jgi:hypothetical protein
MTLLLLLWYCYDDTLARCLDTPNLGELPLWVWALWYALVTLSNTLRIVGRKAQLREVVRQIREVVRQTSCRFSSLGPDINKG